MDFDTRVKLAIYRHFAENARKPEVADVADSVAAAPADVRAAYERLAKSRVLVMDRDGESIRMAPPFSGVPTQHKVIVGEREYFANCAWDTLGILAALQQPGTVRSRCEQSNEPFTLDVSREGPPPSDWLFHCAVPASQWWDNIIFT